MIMECLQSNELRCTTTSKRAEKQTEADEIGLMESWHKLELEQLHNMSLTSRTINVPKAVEWYVAVLWVSKVQDLQFLTAQEEMRGQWRGEQGAGVVCRANKKVQETMRS